jgi:hypothetical protein
MFLAMGHSRILSQVLQTITRSRGQKLLPPSVLFDGVLKWGWKREDGLLG